MLRIVLGESAGTRGMKTPMYAYEGPVTSIPMRPLCSTVVLRMTKLVPVMVTDVPPAVVPLVGATLVTVGGNTCASVGELLSALNPSASRSRTRSR